MNVKMRNFQTCDEETGPRCVERLPHGLTQVACNRGDLGKEVRSYVLPLIDLGAWYDKHVTLRDRCDGQERDNVVVLPYETSW